jgi:hypothetical protein
MVEQQSRNSIARSQAIMTGGCIMYMQAGFPSAVLLVPRDKHAAGEQSRTSVPHLSSHEDIELGERGPSRHFDRARLFLVLMVGAPMAGTCRRTETQRVRKAP